MKDFVIIDIKDPGKFTDVALLVDRPDFLEKIYKFRKKYVKYVVSSVERGKAALEFEQRILLDGLEDELNHDIEQLRTYFNRSRHFRNVIKACVSCMKVTDEDYSRAYLNEEVYEEGYGSDYSEIVYSIVITPSVSNSEINEVLKAFRAKYKRDKNMHKLHSEGQQNAYYHNPYLNYSKDTKDLIKQIRDWYIRRSRGETPLKMALRDKGITYDEYKHIKKQERGSRRYESSDQQELMLKTIYDYRDGIKEHLKNYKRVILESL